MRIIKVKDYEEMSLRGAEIIMDVMKEKDDCVLGLATGSSPIGIYQNLIRATEAGLVSFKHVTTVNLDEYCHLPREHHESYYSFMHNNLFNHVDITEEQVHLPSSLGDDLEKNCTDYNAVLATYRQDIQLLGIGADGHIGFNEPDTPFASKTHIAVLTKKTREDNARFFDNDIKQVPTHAITMGMANIMDARKVLMVISGKNKANAVKKLMSMEVSESFPASLLWQHRDATVIIDDAAASGVADLIK